jgi:hypothetical protein
VKHAEGLQENDFVKEYSTDSIIEPILTNLRDSDTSTGSESNSDSVSEEESD